jgi:hypothetical protein
MFNKFRAVLAAACIVGLPVTAWAQSTVKWGQVGGWDIRVDRSVGNGCFALQGYQDGTMIRVGFNMNSGSVYFTVGNAAWSSLQVGAIYPVVFVFDDASRYQGEMRGVQVGNSVFLLHSSVSAAFTRDFMQRESMRIFYRGAQIAHLSLRNTYAAIAEVANCQQAVASNGYPRAVGVSRDPFSASAWAK